MFLKVLSHFIMKIKNFMKYFKEGVLRYLKQESPAAADKPARRLRKVCTVYVRAVGL